MTGTIRATLLLGLDVGSTHGKAGLFDSMGHLIALATRPMPLRGAAAGSSSFDPHQVWSLVCDAIREVIETSDGSPVAAVGVASMAESGIVLDGATGSSRTQLIPWFDTTAAPDADRLAGLEDQFVRFRRTGQQMNYKAGLAKVLSQVRQRGKGVIEGGKWLSTADFIVYQLTGAIQTDPTLAARTQAFDIHACDWDDEQLERVGLSRQLFPPVTPSGTPAGRLSDVAAAESGLPAGIPVAVAGHDHVVAAYGLGILAPGRVLDSMGTAESMVGALPHRELTERDFVSGLVFGPYATPASLSWMGALPASGGSMEWLRGMLADPYVSYAHLLKLLARAPDGPSPILYFPYLAGAQAPQPDAGARGAFVGLRAGHDASDLALAVLQGAAYEMERIRRSAEALVGPVEEIAVVGGGTRIQRWLQIKADVAGKRVLVSPQTEAAALGAALLAGVGAGVFRDHEEARAAVDSTLEGEGYRIVEPDPVEHRLHLRLLDGPYTDLQEPLRAASHALAGALRDEEGEP